MNGYHVDVLDKGFVTLLNVSGPVRRTTTDFDASAEDPSKSARMSFGKKDEDRSKEQEIKLLNYLISNDHWTPVEMIEVWIEMKLPIFVARQFVRHRTACINEISGRYVQLPDDWYIPSVVGARPTDGAKQGQSLGLDEKVQQEFKDALNGRCRDSYNDYEWALAQGVAPEHARMLLHLNHYTHWLWKQDLRNILGFLKLRIDSHAQIEARAYGQAIKDLVFKALPDLPECAIL